MPIRDTLMQFLAPRAHYFGPPNDEALAGHPLYSRGLECYGAFEIHGSSWIRELERINRVHPQHSPGLFAELRHFAITFHDGLFECVARGARIVVRPRNGNAADPATEMAERLSKPTV